MEGLITNLANQLDSAITIVGIATLIVTGFTLREIVLERKTTQATIWSVVLFIAFISLVVMRHI